jgi:hypothetical protein
MAFQGRLAVTSALEGQPTLTSALEGQRTLSSALEDQRTLSSALEGQPTFVVSPRHSKGAVFKRQLFCWLCYAHFITYSSFERQSGISTSMVYLVVSFLKGCRTKGVGFTGETTWRLHPKLTHPSILTKTT